MVHFDPSPPRGRRFRPRSLVRLVSQVDLEEEPEEPPRPTWNYNFEAEAPSPLRGARLVPPQPLKPARRVTEKVSAYFCMKIRT